MHREAAHCGFALGEFHRQDRKSTRLNSSHPSISYAVFCLNCSATTARYTLSLHDALPIFRLTNPPYPVLLPVSACSASVNSVPVVVTVKLTQRESAMRCLPKNASGSSALRIRAG